MGNSGLLVDRSNGFRHGATPGGARRINRQVVLSTIHHHGPMSRAEVAKRVGLTPVSVSSVVRDLLADELVEELAPSTAGGVGKPATPLAVRADGRHIVAIDLSRRDAFGGAVIDLRGRVVDLLDIARDGRVGDDAFAAVSDLCSKLADRSKRPLLGVGVASPGFVLDASVVLESAHLDWQRIDLGARLDSVAGAPTTVANDANAGALGEVIFGDVGVDDMLYVRVDDGVGAGIVIDKRLHVGPKGGGGEVGHIVVQPDGPICACGNRGCLETLVSEPMSDPTSTPADIEAAGRALGAGLASVVSTLDIDSVVIGGVRNAVDRCFVDAVDGEITARTLPAFAERLTVRPTSLDTDGVLLGAAAIVLDAELGIR